MAKGWTQAQKERLPDGIRELNTGRVLIEFKYTESVTEKALMKTMGNDAYCKDYLELKDSELQTILLSSKSTSEKFLSSCGYKLTGKNGVYRSTQVGFRFVDLILLNELSDTTYNAPFKLFASRRKERDQAFGQLQDSEVFLYSKRLEALSESLFFNLTGFNNLKAEELTMSTEELVKKGWRLMENYWLHHATEEDWEKIPAELKLKGVPVEERLKGVPLEERVKDFSKQELKQLLKKMK